MALIGLSYLLFDPIVKYVILGRLVLRNESDFAELWKKPPITPHFKVNLFVKLFKKSNPVYLLLSVLANKRHEKEFIFIIGIY